MIKYVDAFVVFEEIPDKITLAINISNCQNKCIGCHSPELRCDIGKELTKKEIDMLISNNYGINCVLFMGEGSDQKALLDMALYIKERYQLLVAIYSGRDDVEDYFYKIFNYVKIGPYKEEFGPLNSYTTNQKMFECIDGEIFDITHKFIRKR